MDKAKGVIWIIAAGHFVRRLLYGAKQLAFNAATPLLHLLATDPLGLETNLLGETL